MMVDIEDHGEVGRNEGKVPRLVAATKNSDSVEDSKEDTKCQVDDRI